MNSKDPNTAPDERDILGEILSSSIPESLKEDIRQKCVPSIQDCIGKRRTQFISSISQEDSSEAAFALSFFLDLRFEVNSIHAVEGVLSAKLYSKGVTKNFMDDVRELRALRKESVKTTQDIQTSKRKSLEDARLLESKIAESLKTSEAKLEGHLNITKKKTIESLEQAKQEWASEVDTIKSELERLRDYYKSSIALEAPVSFWEENMREHRKSAKKFFWGLCILVPVIVGALMSIGWITLSDYETHHWGRTTLFLFLSGVMLWVVRIIVKLYLSHKHLETDSRERVVLAKTYLSLLGEGKGPEPGQQDIVYHSLFRPSTTGIIKEDDNPNPVIELINKIQKAK